MIDKYTTTNRGAGVNLDASQDPTQVRNKAPQPKPLSDPQPMRNAVDHHGMKARITRDDLKLAASRWVTLEDTGNSFAKFVQHKDDGRSKMTSGGD
jgi:hypothetical protein